MMAVIQEIEEVLKKYETVPMPYDNIIIRQLVRCIRVVSKGADTDSAEEWYGNIGGHLNT